MFSSRVPGDLAPEPPRPALAARAPAGASLLDLTLSNPTAAGIAISARRCWRRSLSVAALTLRAAAVRPRHGARGDRAPTTPGAASAAAPDRIVLTASTSEAYSLLFKLLCEPAGDRVLTPAPSYPLFDHLTRLDGVERAPIGSSITADGRRSATSVATAWTPDTRAVLAVSPNNPTGSVLSGRRSWRRSRTACAERDAALILDEVFADYPLDPATAHAFTALHAATRDVPDVPPRRTVEVGRAAAGEARMDRRSTGRPRSSPRRSTRLELICDTYLSVSTPVQSRPRRAA